MITYSDKRHEDRIPIEVPVTLEAGTGLSRDISRSGIYFLTEQTMVPGSLVRFSIRLDHIRAGKPLRLDCEGQVLRIEQTSGKYGVAASISEFWCVN